VNALQHAGINAARNLKAQPLALGGERARQTARVMRPLPDYLTWTTGKILCDTGYKGVERASAHCGVTLEPHSHPVSIALLGGTVHAQVGKFAHTCLKGEESLWGRAVFYDIAYLGQAYAKDAPVPMPATRSLWSEVESVRPKVVDEILALVSGWDGEGSVAPSSEAKRVTVSIAAYFAGYLSSAEVEVDPSDGGVAFRWFNESKRALVSVDVRPTGRVIVAGNQAEGRSSRKIFAPDAVGQMLRAAIDAGISQIDDRLP